MEKSKQDHFGDSLNTHSGFSKNRHRVYIETYGCQMNVADTEVVMSVLHENGFLYTDNINKAGIILVNTCSVRENAEQRVWGRLDVFRQIKNKKPELIIGIIGCMAERLKEQILENEKTIDLVAGPDSYRNLPELIHIAKTGQKAINVLLSENETYSDISPLRPASGNISAFVSIMRGCNNMCSYCIVPYTRGRERSRDPDSIVREIKEVIKTGKKEIILLGQNVDSYRYSQGSNNPIINFAKLIKIVGSINPDLRVRFSTSFPKDMSDDVLFTMAENKNICNSIHLPLQSGSSKILKLMKRGYTREWYLERINAINKIIPDCAVSTDIMTGFCTENEQDHQQTLSLMENVEFDFAYMFKYSERPGTFAAKKLKDDIHEEIKSRRLTEIITLQNKLSEKNKKKDIGKVFEVLVEGLSKKSEDHFFGRNSQNKVIVFPRENYKIGDYASVKINDCTSATLIGNAI